MKKFIPLITLFIFFGCTEKKNKANASKNNLTLDRIQDKVFFIGPQLDSAKTEIIAECDCCASDLILKKDSTFVFGSYCLEADDYLSGSYTLKENKLVLNIDSKILEVSYPQVDTIPPKIYSLKYVRPEQIELTLGEVNHLVSFRIKDDFALERNKKEGQKIIKSYKKDSIDIKLGVKL